jgi:heme/copper-type cytochrome/quinol oxidase subunit 2
MSRTINLLMIAIALACLIGTGLLAFVHASESAAPVVVPISPDGVQRATVTLDSYSYSPKHLVVEAGKPVELTLTSVTTFTPHNFLIKELSIEQDVSAGKTKTVKFTPTQAGLYDIYCDKKLLFFQSHREKGMEGKLEIR